MAALREVFAIFGVQFDTAQLQKGAKATNLTAIALKNLAKSAGDGTKEGKAAAKAAKELAREVSRLEKEAENAAKALRDKLAKAAKAAEEKVKPLKEKVTQLATALGVGLAVRAMGQFVLGAVAMGDELDKTARQLGLTTAEFQAFSHAANLGGVDSRALATSIAQLQQRAYEAANGGAEAAKMWKDLGADFRDSNGELLTGSQLMRNVADGLQNQTNSSKRTALAMKLMGEQGARLLPMFEGGSEGINAMTAELDRLGGGASQDFIDQSVEITDSITSWRVSMNSFKSSLLLSFMPGINRAVEAVTEFTAEFSRNAGAVRALKILLGALGVLAVIVAGKMIVAWVAAGWPILLVGVAVALLIGLVDDLWVTWSGGQSVTRDFINSIWPGMVDGLDSTDRAILAITEAIADLIVGFGNLYNAAQPLVDVFLSAFRPLFALLGAFNDIRIGMGIGRTLSRAAGRLTHSGTFGSLIGEDTMTADMESRRAASQEGLGRIGQRITRGRGRRERSMAESLLPEHLQRVGLGNQRRVNAGNQTVSQSIQIDINADGIQNPDEVMAIARREMRDELGRHARELQAQLVPQTQSATGFEWDDG